MNWYPSQYLDDNFWGILDDNNCIVVGLSSRITKETAQIICRAVNAHAELVAALETIKTALNDGDGGSYWPARKFLDERGIYNGDLNDLRVLDAVASAALAKVKK